MYGIRYRRLKFAFLKDVDEVNYFCDLFPQMACPSLRSLRDSHSIPILKSSIRVNLASIPFHPFSSTKNKKAFARKTSLGNYTLIKF